MGRKILTALPVSALDFDFGEASLSGAKGVPACAIGPSGLAGAAKRDECFICLSRSGGCGYVRRARPRSAAIVNYSAS
jgi:hypothetical protein